MLPPPSREARQRLAIQKRTLLALLQVEGLPRSQ